MPDVSQFRSAESVAAFAGLAPQQFRSGKSVHKRTRLSKSGKRHLRQALYFPAVTAIGHNPLVRALYERLVAAGKARVHHVLPRTGWVSYPIRGEEDVEGALELFRRNYERLTARGKVRRP